MSRVSPNSGVSLSDFFGLPASSSANTYNVFEIAPRSNSVNVFQSIVAPTTELGGRFRTNGGARQIIVPDRSQFTSGRLIGTIPNSSNGG